MPRMPLHPASGTGIVEAGKKVIRCVKYGCANRPFFHIVVANLKSEQKDPPIEQVGSWEKTPNSRNERLVALNLERIFYWLGEGAEPSRPIAELLGLAGILPVHPRTYMKTWRNNLKIGPKRF